MSYSQLNQDLHVLKFFDHMDKLYFLDIGANDGKTLSNTYLLETNYQWEGICVEPLPDTFQELKKCRKVHCDDHAIFSKDTTVEFSKHQLYSGITEFIDQHTLVKNSETIIVKTITLNELLRNYKAPKIIHYCSLDTEGTELEILKSVDLKKYTFLYINVEHNYVEPRRTYMKALLQENGYLYKGENNWDDDYIHESNIVGTYYYKEDYTKPTKVKRIYQNIFNVKSMYWDDDYGEFKNGFIEWKKLGKCEINYNNMNFGGNNIWKKK